MKNLIIIPAAIALYFSIKKILVNLILKNWLGWNDTKTQRQNTQNTD